MPHFLEIPYACEGDLDQQKVNSGTYSENSTREVITHLAYIDLPLLKLTTNRVKTGSDDMTVLRIKMQNIENKSIIYSYNLVWWLIVTVWRLNSVALGS